MKKHPYPVESDDYLNNSEKMEEISQYCDPQPVDLNGGLVPTDKNSFSEKKVEDSISERFSL